LLVKIARHEQEPTVFSPVDLLVICLINLNINAKAPSKRR